MYLNNNFFYFLKIIFNMKTLKKIIFLKNHFLKIKVKVKAQVL